MCTTLIFSLFILLYYLGKAKIRFFITGVDSGFSFQENLMLWKLASLCNLKEPQTLFWSVSALTNCISQIIEQSQKSGTEKSESLQKFLSKLYAYRTKTEIEFSKKKGIDSTHSLDVGQKLVIVLPQKGIFTSSIVNNAHELTIRLPALKNGVYKADGNFWTKRDLSVYLWRKKDANYVFDTHVLGSGTFMGEPVLYLAHTNNLLRDQKRKTVRADCHITATLSFVIPDDSKTAISSVLEQSYRCFLENVSESGALIRIGGKGISNIKIKLKFKLGAEDIIMFGVVKSAEYNETLNQSRLHFECYKIDPKMKNSILTFVYNILPEDQKLVLQALEQTEAEAISLGETGNASEEDGKSANIKIPEPLFNEEPDVELEPVDENEGEKI